MTTYTVSTWDHENDSWTPTHRVSKWGLRRALRELYGGGWSEVSVLVQADGNLLPAARSERVYRVRNKLRFTEAVE